MNDYGGMFANAAGSAAGGIFMNWANQAINYKYGRKMADYNFGLNEKAADAADARRRALYADFESPMAKIRQLKEAGLSPSLYAGAELGGGIGSTSGAQGAGGSGASIPSSAASPLDLSAINLNNALANKANEEAGKTKTENDIKSIEKELKQMERNLYGIDYDLVTCYVTNEDGTTTSLFDIAKNCDNYDKFVEECKKLMNNAKMNLQIDTEQGQKTMRSIYQNTHQYSHDIATLNAEELNANFTASLVKALKNTEYAKLNADAAVKYLRANAETDELTASQKQAWNDLLDEIGKHGQTYKDIAIILGMLVQYWIANAKVSYNGGTTNNNNYNFTTNNNVKP